MAKQLPDFDLLVPWYPGKDRTAASVKQEIGGSVSSPDVDDTCIVRLSKPLNYNDHKIPSWTESFRTRQGTDKNWYGLRVKEFWTYMEKIYGPPTRHAKQPIDAKKFQGIRGIIGFRVPFKDGSATGHFTFCGTALTCSIRAGITIISRSQPRRLFGRPEPLALMSRMCKTGCHRHSVL